MSIKNRLIALQRKLRPPALVPATQEAQRLTVLNAGLRIMAGCPEPGDEETVLADHEANPPGPEVEQYLPIFAMCEEERMKQADLQTGTTERVSQ